MTEGWAYGGAPPAASAAGAVTLVEGASFSICESSGDVHAGCEQGLFYRDTRYVSEWILTVDGHRVEPLSATVNAPYAATFIGRRPPRPGVADSTLLVVRRRYVGNGMLEEITLENLAGTARDVELVLHVAADFAGLFEVKEGRAAPRAGVTSTSDGPSLRMQYAVGAESRGVTVTTDGDAAVSAGQVAWQRTIPPRQHVSVSVLVCPSVDGVDAPAQYHLGEPPEHSAPAGQLEQWRRRAPVVASPSTKLTRLLATSAVDLGALRIHDAQHPDRTVVAAGVPWFMTLFGRDSLLTSWMLLPVDASLAVGTLRTLAELQGQRVDPVTEEEPGRILHEIRSGLDAQHALGGGNVYYGTADATPLFVMLLGELRRWGLAPEEVEELLPHADRALTWITEFGDRDGDGFVEYERATERGLVNQGWKDSFDAISFASGELAEAPIALAEVQGYVYGAYLARSHFARAAGDDDTAAEWTERARILKKRFNEAFWLPDHGYYALALDRDKRPVDALASNMGHCLWTGIVPQDRAASVVRHLLGPEMYSGFGVRTLASSSGAYNPMSYHNGSVWPHDNAIIAAGLARYGFVDETQQLARALLDAAQRFAGRLPELFCGFDRDDYDPPVAYPTSCSPQAWAAGAPLLLLRSLLRFDPWVPFGRVWCDPAVPPELLPLRVSGVHLGESVLSLDVAADGGWRLTGLTDGVAVTRSTRDPETAH